MTPLGSLEEATAAAFSSGGGIDWENTLDHHVSG